MILVADKAKGNIDFGFHSDKSKKWLKKRTFEIGIYYACGYRIILWPILMPHVIDMQDTRWAV